MLKRVSILYVFSALPVVLAISNTASAQSLPAALGTGFTYQGRLTDGGAPASGTYDLEFKLYDAVSGGSAVGSAVTRDDVTVTNGLFAVQLDFGDVFDGTALCLEIGVRPGTDTGPYTALAPRQPLSAAPYANYASKAPWSGLSGVPAGIGDVTAVHPGDGLVGGGESGDVTLSVGFDGTGFLPSVAHSDHNHSGVYSIVGHTHPGTSITSAVAQAGNADTLDGQHGSYYQNASSINSGTLNTSYYSAYTDLGAEGYLAGGANNLALNNGALQATLNADMLDGLHSSSFVLGSHDHWGQTWTGAGTGLTLSGGATGVSGSGSNYGVYGSGSTTGSTGVRGFGGQYGTGVDGYSATGAGVSGYGFFGVNGSSTGTSGSLAGRFNGNVEVTGNFTVSGSKSAVVGTKNHGTRTLYAVESPGNWFEDFGTGQLTNGAAVITIETVFAETVNVSNAYHVFLTPMGDCALYIDEKSPTAFTVRAVGGQACSIAFDYRIVAKRLGYEEMRLTEVAVPPTVGLSGGSAR